MTGPADRHTHVYLRLVGYLRPYRWMFALGIVATLLLSATDPAIAAMIKPLMDGTFIARDPRAIWLYPLALVGLFVLRGLAAFASGLATSWVGSRVVTDLRSQMFDRLLHLPGLFYDQSTGGALISKFTYDTTQLLTATTTVLVTLVRDSLSVLGLLGLMLYLDWKLSCVFLVSAPIIAWIARLVSGRMRRLSRGLQDAMGELTQVLDEAIGGERIIKVYNAQQQENAAFTGVARRVHHLYVKARAASEAFSPAIQLIAVAALGLVIYIAARHAVDGERSVGEIVAFFGAMGMLLAPLKRLTRINEPLQRGIAAAQSVFELLDRQVELDSGSYMPDRVRGELALRDVSFRYPESDDDALCGVTLTIAPGETVALVGPSGSGKSTLAKLLPRIYDPSSGALLLDAVDLREYDLKALRSAFAYVGQETVLFHASVAGNIAFGQPDLVGSDAVPAAARRASALEFIDRLPQRFETQVGEEGQRLSGGQRQRLALARAFLRDAPILVLDEATSALDNTTESLIQQALEADRGVRTTVIIAHRLSTVVNADRIVFLERGRIVEQGRHEELLELGGHYAKLFSAQEPQGELTDANPG